MFGLYLHVPFCVAKCHYCDFNSRPPREDGEFDSYVAALCSDIRSQKRRDVTTVFLGGGTPSILPGRQMARILDAVRDAFALAPDCEITMEANPGTVDAGKFEAFRQAGVTRLSIGVQSTHRHLLAVLGRRHSWEEAQEACRAARRAGFDNINLDLMFGLPGQTLAEWDATLRDGIALGPEHLSTYSLIVEEDTYFGTLSSQGRLPLPDEDLESAMADLGRERSLAAGYEPYETSAWSRPGRRCAHNLLYWGNGEYLGLGAGAVSYVDGWRWMRVRRPSLYVERVRDRESLIETAERVSEVTSLHETLALGLRRFDGIDLRAVERRYHLEDGILSESLPRFLEDESRLGLVAFDGPTLRLTWNGMRVSNAIVVRLMQCWPYSERVGAYVSLVHRTLTMSETPAMNEAMAVCTPC